MIVFFFFWFRAPGKDELPQGWAWNPPLAPRLIRDLESAELLDAEVVAAVRSGGINAVKTLLGDGLELPAVMPERYGSAAAGAADREPAHLHPGAGTAARRPVASPEAEQIIESWGAPAESVYGPPTWRTERVVRAAGVVSAIDPGSGLRVSAAHGPPAATGGRVRWSRDGGWPTAISSS